MWCGEGVRGHVAGYIYMYIDMYIVLLLLPLNYFTQFLYHVILVTHSLLDLVISIFL